jgi:hypothetical protein
MHDDFDPQHPVAFVVDLQGQPAEVDFADRQVIGRLIEHPREPRRRRVGRPPVMRTALPAEDGLQGGHVQDATGPVDEPLVDLLQPSSSRT